MPIKITPKKTAKINIVKKSDSAEKEKPLEQVSQQQPVQEVVLEEQQVIVIRSKDDREDKDGVGVEQPQEGIKEEVAPPEKQILIKEKSGPLVAKHFESIESVTMNQLLKDLAGKWESFRAKPRAKLCRFVIDPMEVAILEQFFELEKTEDKHTSDLFLKFTSNFESSFDYSVALIEELKEQIQNELSFENRIAHLYWEEWKSDALLQGPEYFVRNLSLFFQDLVKETDKQLVAYLAPEETSDFNQWMHWIGRVLEGKIPENVCFLLTDFKEEQTQQDLRFAFPVKIYSEELNLNIEGLLKGLSEPTEDRQPDEFRDLMAQLVQTPAADSTTIARLEDRLVELCEDNGWPHLRVCVHNIVGQKLLEIEYHEAAYKKHQQSREVAGAIEEYEERGALAEGLTAESLKSLYPESIFAQAMACYQVGFCTDFDAYLSLNTAKCQWKMPKVNNVFLKLSMTCGS